MLLAISTMVWFACFATLIGCGSYGVDVCFQCHIHSRNDRNILITKLIIIIQLKYLDFVLLFRLYKDLEFLEFFQALSFGVQYVHPYLLRKIVNEGDKISCTTYRCGLHGTIHVQMYNLQRLSCSSPSIIWKRCIILLPLNACFTI